MTQSWPVFFLKVLPTNLTGPPIRLVVYSIIYLLQELMGWDEWGGGIMFIILLNQFILPLDLLMIMILLSGWILFLILNGPYFYCTRILSNKEGRPVFNIIKHKRQHVDLITYWQEIKPQNKF